MWVFCYNSCYVLENNLKFEACFPYFGVLLYNIRSFAEKNMIRFNWKKVYTVAEGSSSKAVDIIHYITFKPIPTRRSATSNVLFDNWNKIAF